MYKLVSERDVALPGAKREEGRERKVIEKCKRPLLKLLKCIGVGLRTLGHCRSSVGLSLADDSSTRQTGTSSSGAAGVAGRGHGGGCAGVGAGTGSTEATSTSHAAAGAGTSSY